MTEKQLITRCRRNDRAAQQTLYETYAAKMYGVCLRYVRNRDVAQDLMHDGFITVFSKIGDFRAEGSFEGWMRRIFVNTALGHLRKNNVLNEALQVDAAESVRQFDDKDCSAIERMQAAELLKCIDLLPEGYRVVLNLFAIEGYSHREIADMLQISEGTSRSQYSRARNYLYRVLEKAEII